MSPATPPPDGGSDPLRRVAIVGCGLIGGSLGLALAALDTVEKVRVTDRDPAVLERARGRHPKWAVARDLRGAVGDAELVVLAVPVGAITAVAREAAGWMETPAILTDVGSVKTKVVREIESFLPDFIQYVGGHPMTGSEQGGLEGSDSTLFQGAAYVLTPTAATDPAAFNRLASVLRAVGARVLAVDPDLHDRLVGVVSHLPHLLASLLMQQAGDGADHRAGALAVAAGGFRDVTRVAASDPELWVDILRENRAAVLEALTGFEQRLRGVRAAIEGEGWDDIRRLLSEARAARALLPRKPDSGVLTDLVVPVPDRPGTLADVTTALGRAGINIEDIALRHASEGGRGALVIALAGEGVAERARAVLAERGYPSHVQPR